MRGKPVFASITSVPAKVTRAWDTGYSIVVCVWSNPVNSEEYAGHTISMIHPDGKHSTGVKLGIRRFFKITPESVIYMVNSYSVGTGCSRYDNLSKRSKVVREIPVANIDEVSKPGFLRNNPELVYYKILDKRIASLGYFSRKPFFGNRNNINIDMRDIEVQTGRKAGNPVAAVFLPFAAAVDVTAATVSFGVVGVACGASKQGCR